MSRERDPVPVQSDYFSDMSRRNTIDSQTRYRRESMSDSSELSQSDDLRVSDSDLNQHCSSCRKDQQAIAGSARIRLGSDPGKSRYNIHLIRKSHAVSGESFLQLLQC